MFSIDTIIFGLTITFCSYRECIEPKIIIFLLFMTKIFCKSLIRLPSKIFYITFFYRSIHYLNEFSRFFSLTFQICQMTTYQGTCNPTIFASQGNNYKQSWEINGNNNINGVNGNFLPNFKVQEKIIYNHSYLGFYSLI